MLGKFSVSDLFRIACFMGMACASAVPAGAECIGFEGSAICLSLDAASVVFLADVESVRVVEGDVEVRFRVLEAFKGGRAGEQTIRFRRSTAEDFRFQSGQRVLLYASTFRGELGTQCTRTRLASQGDAELTILRALVSARPGGLLDGNLVSVEGGVERTNRYPGFRVTLHSKSGTGPTASAITNDGGHFQFDWVSPGDYVLVLNGGSSFADERREVTIRVGERCLTLPKFVLRSR